MTPAPAGQRGDHAFGIITLGMHRCTSSNTRFPKLFLTASLSWPAGAQRRWDLRGLRHCLMEALREAELAVGVARHVLCLWWGWQLRRRACSLYTCFVHLLRLVLAVAHAEPHRRARLAAHALGCAPLLASEASLVAAGLRRMPRCMVAKPLPNPQAAPLLAAWMGLPSLRPTSEQPALHVCP